MARRLEVVAKRKKPDREILASVTEELRLPSLGLDPPRVEGFAYRFKLLLPVLSATGEPVFTGYHLRILHELFDEQFGGSLASTGTTQPAWYGSYRPTPDAEPVQDFHCILYVYTRQIEAADRFFQLLKTWLKTAGLQEQDEILIERAPVWLVETALLPR
jgi:hypothetical protein